MDYFNALYHLTCPRRMACVSWEDVECRKKWSASMSNRISFYFFNFWGQFEGIEYIWGSQIHTLYFVLVWNTATCTHHHRKPHHHLFFYSVVHTIQSSQLRPPITQQMSLQRVFYSQHRIWPALHKCRPLPVVEMKSWLAICGLFAAIVSMVLDVAQFWRDVGPIFLYLPLIQTDRTASETLVLVEIQVSSR